MLNLDKEQRLEQLKSTRVELLSIGDLLDLGRLDPHQQMNGRIIENKIRETMSRLYSEAVRKSDQNEQKFFHIETKMK